MLKVKRKKLLNHLRNSVVVMWENCPAFLTGAFHISIECCNVSSRELSMRSVDNSVKTGHISMLDLQHRTCGKLFEFSTNAFPC